MIYCFQIGETDMYVEYDYKVTSKQRPATWEDPADPMEYETTVMGLYEDELVREKNRKELECPEWLAKMLQEEMNYSDRVYNDIIADLG